MPMPAQFTANHQNTQKSTGSRTATCDYARNHFTHFRTILDIISAIFKPSSANHSQSILIASICGYECCIHKTLQKTNPMQEVQFWPSGKPKSSNSPYFRQFPPCSRSLSEAGTGAKRRPFSPEQTQFRNAFNHNYINHLTHVVQK
jgi:hypothetical protein